jgi:hypothetical protein
MYNVQMKESFRFHKSSTANNRAWLPLAATILIIGIALSVTSSLWNSLWYTSNPSVQAAAAPLPRINAPFFPNTVPFNQTAIFWFGAISSSTTYTDVRIGYSNSELYIDLRNVDRYLWYDPNKNAPNLNNGDNASLYLSTSNATNTQLDAHAYQFQTAVNGFKKWPTYQQAFTGQGTTWTAVKLPFTTDYGWRGHGFNGGGSEDAGWSMTYHIPFSSLKLSAPAQGTLWKLGVRVHNRDDAANTHIPDTWWPQAAASTNPASWGQLSFGIPAYQAPKPGTTTVYTVRNKLNNQVVTDGMVGGSLGCGSALGDKNNRWKLLGSQSYPGAIHVNIMNESDISDWDCFSKFYITFPLSALPKGKAMVNAKITLYEYANAGVQGQPNPSYIQVGMVNQDWKPATLSWNSAPLLQENLNNILVPTKSKPVIPWPGLAITWDVSRAVAQAYAAGQPLRLVFYDTDNQYNSGKYFTSSTVGDWDATGRPTLQVTLGG